MVRPNPDTGEPIEDGECGEGSTVLPDDEGARSFEPAPPRPPLG